MITRKLTFSNPSIASQIPSTEKEVGHLRVNTLYTINGVLSEDSMETSAEKSLKKFNTGGDDSFHRCKIDFG